MIPNVTNWQDWEDRRLPDAPRPDEKPGTRWILLEELYSYGERGDILELQQNNLGRYPLFRNLTTGKPSETFYCLWKRLAPFDPLNSSMIKHFNPPNNKEINVGAPYFSPLTNMSNNNIFTLAKDLVKSIFTTEPEKSLQESGLENADGTPTDLGVAMMQLEAWKKYRTSEECQSLVKAIIEKKKLDEKKG